MKGVSRAHTHIGTKWLNVIRYIRQDSAELKLVWQPEISVSRDVYKIPRACQDQRFGVMSWGVFGRPDARYFDFESSDPNQASASCVCTPVTAES